MGKREGAGEGATAIRGPAVGGSGGGHRDEPGLLRERAGDGVREPNEEERVQRSHAVHVAGPGQRCAATSQMRLRLELGLVGRSGSGPRLTLKLGFGVGSRGSSYDFGEGAGNTQRPTHLWPPAQEGGMG